LNGLIEDADYLMAHKAEFDKGFIETAMAHRGYADSGKQWLCSMEDIRYPPEIKTRNLLHLAAEHGFAPSFRHRAIFDVLTMLKVAESYNLEDIIARSQEPTVYVQAIVSFDEKELAKERGYHWCGAKKTWWRSWKQNDFEADKAECGFRTVILQGPPE
jgi:DNA polymerase-3 subunit epsilon